MVGVHTTARPSRRPGRFLDGLPGIFSSGYLPFKRQAPASGGLHTGVSASFQADTGAGEGGFQGVYGGTQCGGGGAG